VPDCALRLTLKGHSCNVGAVVFHPSAVKEEESPVCALASCAADGSVKLWTMKRYADLLNGCGVTCTVVVLTWFVMCMCGCVYVWVCVYVGFVMCGCVYVWVCVYVGFVMCGCAYVWVL
jgi:hypothetical protein